MSGTETPPPDDFPAEVVEKAVALLDDAIGESWVVSAAFVSVRPDSGEHFTAVATHNENPTLATALALAMADEAARTTKGCDCAGCQAIRLHASEFIAAMLKSAARGRVHP